MDSIKNLNPSVLAFVGDAVYELYVSQPCEDRKDDVGGNMAECEKGIAAWFC